MNDILEELDGVTQSPLEETKIKKFIGTKIIMAVAMGLVEAQELLKRNVGYQGLTDEKGNADGYLVTYHNKPNPYQAWSPKDVFEEAYRPIDGMTFGLAIEALKKGKKVARSGWNGRGMYVRFVDTTETLNRHFELFNVAGTFDTWVASVSDTLAEDWQILD